MFTKLERIDDHSENFNKQRKYKKVPSRKLTELKNTITVLKNILQAFNSRVDDTEQISDLEDKVVEITQTEQQKKKKNF